MAKKPKKPKESKTKTDGKPSAATAPASGPIPEDKKVGPAKPIPIPDEKRWKEILDAKRSADQADREVCDAEDKVNEAKGVLKAAQTRATARNRELRELLGDAQKGQLRLDFGTAGTPGPDAWRTVTLDKLDITGKLAEHLTDAKLTTLGAIADYTSKPLNKLTDIKGIGEAAAGKIEDKLAAYWKKNPLPKADIDTAAFTHAEIVQAAEHAFAATYCTVALLQRELKLSYSRAVGLVGELVRLKAIEEQESCGVKHALIWGMKEIVAYKDKHAPTPSADNAKPSLKLAASGK